jgi:hypothetical protein
MASSFLTNFIGGVADYGLDQIKTRQANEQEMKKAKMLAQLRLETDKELATFTNDLEQQNTDSKASGPDLQQGVYIYRDKQGNEKSRRPLTDTEKQEVGLALKKDQLDVENVQSTISSRAADDARANASLGLERLRTNDSLATGKATRASLDGTKNSGTGSSSGIDDRANELLYRNKAIQEDLVRNYGIGADAVAMLAANSVAEAAARNKPELAESIFQHAVQGLKDKAKLDTAHKWTRSLDKTQ